jgi:hypothetical protein
MAGLVPAIHVFLLKRKDVDARHSARHDGGKVGAHQLENALASGFALRFESIVKKQCTARLTRPVAGGI